jgi:hypothetical protein
MGKGAYKPVFLLLYQTMRKHVARICVSLLSFFIGFSCTLLLSSLHTLEADKPLIVPNSGSKRPLATASAPKFVFAPKQEDKPLLLNKICTSSDRLEYKGYEVSREYDQRAEKSKVTIKKDGRVLGGHNNGEGLANIEASCFGLYPVLSGKTEQLVIVQTSGGVHCCYSYRIYDLDPTFRLLFDSEKYPIGDGFDELEFKDINGDGVQEFTQRAMTFDYWDDLSYVESPQPRVVFQYDPQAKRFYPASKKFSTYLLKDVKEDIRKLNPEDPAQFWASELDITLRYIYAGKEKEGWKFFERDGRDDKTKYKIKKTLRQDALYRFINGR